MRRSPRLLAALAASATAIVALVLPAVSATAEPAAPAVVTQTAGFDACIAGGGTADVLLLIDESSSLTQTDPQAARVTSARYFVDQLRRFSTRTGRSVEVQVAGFGDRYTRVGGWNRIAASTPGLDSAITSFRTRTAGFDTDYWTALHRAQLDLGARASAEAGRHCQAVVWFTDGELGYFARTTAAEQSEYGERKVFAPNVDLTTSAAAKRVFDLAATDLCRAGGIADQLRSSDITIFAVGLDGASTSPRQFDRMQSIATGKAGSTACGTVATTGTFTRASDIDSLLQAFDGIGTPDSPAIVQTKGICARAEGVCAGGAHRFVLDASTPEVQVLASASKDGLEVRLLSPGGTLIRIPSTGSDSRSVGGVQVAYSWVTGRSVTLQLAQGSAPDKAWQGLWQLAFVAPPGTSTNGSSRTSIHILSPITPTVSGVGAEVRQDASGKATFGLAVRGRTIDPASLLGDVAYTAVLVDSTGASHPVLSTTDKAAIATPVAVPLRGVPLGGGSLDLEVRITTAAATAPDGTRVAGTELAPKRVSVPLTVLPPERYPTVATAIDFGRVTGTASAHATLVTRGPGCVWIPDGTVTVQAGPSDVRSFRVASGSASSQASCVTVGATGRVPLELTADGAGNGVLNGTVKVGTGPSDGGAALVATVAVTAQYAKPLNTTNFLLTLIAALLLGPGAPLLLFYLMKFLVSRIPPRSLVGVLIPVRIDGGSVLRDGRRFAVKAEDFQRPVAIGPRGERRVDAAGFGLAVRLGPSPFGLGRVAVEAPGRLAISDADDLRFHEPAMLPLAVHDHFVLLRSPGAAEETAEILLLMAGDAGPVEQRELADRIERHAPAMHDVLLGIERERGTSQTPGASSGGSPYGGEGPVPVPPPSSNDQWSF